MNQEPKEPSPDPTTGVRRISSEEFVAKVAAQLNGTNGIHKPGEADESFFEAHEDADREAETQALAEKPIPPHDLDAEAAVLSAILLDRDALGKVHDILHAEHFYSEAHRLIYRTCVDLLDNETPIDVVTVATHLKTTDRLGSVGGMAYLTEILNAAPAVTNVRSYARTVTDLSFRRTLIECCDLAKISCFHNADSSSAIRLLQSKIETFSRPDRFQTPIDVLDEWIDAGPLVHEPTGIPPIDNATGGGPVYGSRWIVNGAPDAGKTAILVQIAHTYALRGVAVGFLAADEESSDLQTRLAQRMEFSRLDCEIRNPNTLGLMREAFGGLPVRFYRADMTLEAASDDLALWARQRGVQAALFVDSIQTVVCSKVVGTDDISTRELVTENVRALKNCAMRHKIITMATSEMNRAAYKNGNTSDTNDMASGAESRAIEYLARVLLTLRSVKGSPDLVEVAIPKNKHGRSGESFFLRIDRRRMALYESEGPVVPNAEATKEDEKAVRERLAAEALAAREASEFVARQTLFITEEAAMVAIIRENPGIGLHKLRGAMAAKLDKCGKNRTEDCLARLELKKIVRTTGGGPGIATKHYLNE